MGRPCIFRFLRRRRRLSQLERLRLFPLTVVTSPSWPRTLLGKSRLYLRAFDSPAAQALDGTEGAWQPFWSPDSRFLGYFAQGKLKKIPVGGGPPEPLCDVAEMDGRNLEPGRGDSLQPCYGLYRVSQDGGVATPVATTLEGTRQESQIETGRCSPYFLPDGRHFLFSAVQPPAGNPRYLCRVIRL